MTIDEAIKEIISSPEFQARAKNWDPVGSRYRHFKWAFKKGHLKTGSKVHMLEDFGYSITAIRPNPIKKLATDVETLDGMIDASLIAIKSIKTVLDASKDLL